ncbi:hypothetical protein OE88DRAFT_1785665 [Heliocybe sulcata]|uniref:DUF7082 domain-containing protein n=1 Tax=Heliocybe sulcata TaxID=5364 RepID=A0A5C3NDG0_9AGAM|nr:hypothetical protein OE88DRAFT_1785665 [Heliocybe sulcata]
MPPYRTSANPTAAMADVTLRVQPGSSYIAPSLLPYEQYPLPLAPVDYPNSSIQVFDYAPKFGLPGSAMLARVQYTRDVTEEICLRLVFGTKPVRTKCKQVGTLSYELTAVVPELQPPAERVVVLVQALTLNDQVLDTVVVGIFAYGDQIIDLDDSSAVAATDATSQTKRLPYNDENARTAIDPSVVNVQSSAPLSDKAPTRRRGRATSTHTSTSRTQSLMRTRPAAVAHCVVKKAVLETVTPLDTMAVDWQDDEKKVGRRLVRFHVERHDHILKVSCERIKQSEYDERDIVVSCIQRTESGVCYITSVDIIYLLERIVGTVFRVEEKNRIRRNLEGLKPITTGKGKKSCQAFFQKIMDFPNPKPRTIEKDLKVFEWHVLGQALDKIISRYSLYSVPTDGTAQTANGESDPEEQYTPGSEYAFDPVQGLMYSAQGAVESAGVPSNFAPLSYPRRSHSLSPTFSPDLGIAGPNLAFSGTSSEGSSTHSSPILCNSPLEPGMPSHMAGRWVGETPMDAYNMIHHGPYLPPQAPMEPYAVNPEHLTSNGYSYPVYQDPMVTVSGYPPQYCM